MPTDIPSSRLSWRTAKLPENTAVFAIGDIHGHSDLLAPMLKAIEDKIAQLPPGTKAHVVFIGDYIDRGPDAPEAIGMLLDFKERMEKQENAEAHFLCGNHDEYFKRLLEAKVFTDKKTLGKPDEPGHYTHCLTDTDGSLTLQGLENWLFSGGGIDTLDQYLKAHTGDPVPAAIVVRDPENPYKSHLNYANPNLIADVEQLVETLRAAVPEKHQMFFNDVYDKASYILPGSQYLFTHAGIDPDKPLEAQGIGEGVPQLKGKEYADFLMSENDQHGRDHFLWESDDVLSKGKYVIVHGHTPSAIKNIFGHKAVEAVEKGKVGLSSFDTAVDGERDFRLCIDTDVCKPQGALTCFVRCGDKAEFMAVNKSDPEKTVEEYEIPIKLGHLAGVMHRMRYPEFHGAAVAQR